MTILSHKESILSCKPQVDYLTIYDGNPSLTLIQPSQEGLQWGVKQFQEDLLGITNMTFPLSSSSQKASNPILEIKLIGEDSSDSKQEYHALKDKWDSYIIEVSDKAISIIGSNIRGALYGIFDLSRQLGVSPWHWWADVPHPKHNYIAIKKGTFTSGEPAIRYRGFFINDEYPCLGNWAHEKFESLNHEFYEHVFDLLLRLRGNYLWPAMWDDCFYDDDPQNHILADKLGIIMGTSHHEPMMRNWKEWGRYGEGEWDFNKNLEQLKQYWTQSIKRMGSYESLVTVGMRGDGDEPLTNDKQADLLEKIIKTQRDILQEVTHKKPQDIPQMWAVYKEVQDVYEQGFEIPEDIIIMLCDDNWGNLRIIPPKDKQKHKAGYGLYYHFDYVGGPRNYKWISSTNLSRTWEQLTLAYNSGIQSLWIVNGGDIKFQELPLSFFMDMAWNPEDIKSDEIANYLKRWTYEQFGIKDTDLSQLIEDYLLYSSRRRPELLDKDTYTNKVFNERDRIQKESIELQSRLKQLKTTIPESYQDSFYQLIEYPLMALSNLHLMYIYQKQNEDYSLQERSSTNAYAYKVMECYVKDKALTNQYHSLREGKWNHMASQNHISYTYWQQPEIDLCPETKLLPIQENVDIQIDTKKIVIESQQQEPSYIDIYNRGCRDQSYQIKCEVDWLKLASQEGIIHEQVQIPIEIHWDQVDQEELETSIIITAGIKEWEVKLVVRKKDYPTSLPKGTFLPYKGITSIKAKNFKASYKRQQIEWKVIPGIGREGSGITTFPIGASCSNTNILEHPSVVYDLYLDQIGEYWIYIQVAPSNDFLNKGGLCYGISWNQEEPRVINIHEKATKEDWFNPVTTNDDWNKAVGNNIRTQEIRKEINKTGIHQLQIWMIDPGIVIQNIVLSQKDLGSWSLSPTESRRS
ncbi:glycosyl hydrolase 115 family protein [Spirochaeta cellobiosiphila]|uniref:glycosyl hydrolase 115 family protein n=1 Tax=Spirochaeta cellobiosiphila TaxID=504483 RepID=UPI0003FE5BB1|nr:glycosyl hydrolase 115 family protein [Spirochaeta cellobiosiphila]